MTVKLEFRNLTETRALVVVEDSTPAMMNAIRQTLVSDIPKMAIEMVEFHLGPIRDQDGREYESISPLFDEILSHRLGLVPIPTDLDFFNFREGCECEGEGCPKCSIMYVLNKKGPCTVYSGDLEPVGDSSLKIKEDLIPLVKLSEGQAPLIYATAILGTGRTHAKWQVCHGVGYKYYPIVKINAKKCDQSGACVRICPRDVLVEGDKKIEVADAEACTLCMSCIQKCENDAITVEGDKTKFVLTFETDGSVSAQRALMYALDILVEKAEAFREGVSSMG
jgi:DNA-directed RNA polymerase subunit D